VSLDSDLYSGMTGYAGLYDLIGDRLYPVSRPQGATLPAMTYQLISHPREQAINGTIAGGLARVQFSYWGTTHDAVEAIGSQLVAALVAWSASTVHGVVIDNEMYDDEPDSQLQRGIVDALITYTG
jgi:hypothetical protein